MSTQRLYEMVRDVCGELNASFLRERESIIMDACFYRVRGEPVVFSGLELAYNKDEKALRSLVEAKVKRALS